jgi:antitoxin (DNA-binding transcriptional repressor) of toxin-antitoxin stability system
MSRRAFPGSGRCWPLRKRRGGGRRFDRAQIVATLVVTTHSEVEMRSVGVREFRDQASTMMAAGETLVIERHGEPIGFFVPVTAKDRRAGRKALGRLGAAVDVLTTTTGISEDDLVDEVTSGRRRR